MLLVFSLKNLSSIIKSKFFLLFSPRTFTIVHFTVRSVVHFEIIFEKGVRIMHKFNVLAYRCTIIPSPCLKKTPFSPLNWLWPSVKNYNFVNYIFVCVSQFLGSIFCYCLNYCSFINGQWNRVLWIYKLYFPSLVLYWLF